MAEKPTYEELEKRISELEQEKSEHKQTANKLLQNQYLLQKSQEIGQIGTWELDTLKNKLLWTDETYKIFGIPIGKKLTYPIFLNCVHPDDREYVDTEWKAAFNKKPPYDIEHRLLVDGRVKWVREKAELEFDEKNECIRGIGFVQDITEKKKIERKLKKWNEELEKKIIEKTGSLSDVNTALRVLLKKREKDKDDISENIYTNYKSLIKPLFKQLRDRHTKNILDDILDILESSIKDIITPFSKKLSDPMVGLTPTEIQVALLVKEGKTNKEIAQILIKSIRTVSAHRENIRQKFGLKKTKTNLRTYLLSL